MSLLSFLKMSKVRGTCRLKVSNTLTLSALSTLSKSVESEGDLPAKSVQHFDTFGTFNTFKSDESAKSVGCISSDGVVPGVSLESPLQNHIYCLFPILFCPPHSPYGLHWTPYGLQWTPVDSTQSTALGIF